MPVYAYKGIDSAGKNVNGIVDAESDKAARLKLRRSGTFTTNISLEGGARQGGSFLQSLPFFKKVKTPELAHMTRQLSTLLNANIPLVDALGALQDQIENPNLKKAISEIKNKVVEGSRLAQSLKSFPDIFNPLFIHMVEAGEASGALEQVLARLADFTESQAELTSKVKGALMYPLIMSLVGMGLMFYLLVSVVPKIVKVFENSDNAVLPLPTRILMWVSEFAQDYWYLIILFGCLLIWLYKKYSRTPDGRFKIDRYSLKAPIFGELFRKIAISRFSRTLSTLLKSGVQLLQALDIVKNVVNNVVLAKAIETTKDSVREGESVAEPLKRSGQFPPMVVHMIAVGEKTGSLEVMLEKVADSYDTEVNTIVGSLTTLLEPIMILVMGSVVTFIVLSILLPILKMSEL